MTKTRRVTTSDGVRLHVQEEGCRDRPTLLFCNGLGTDLHLWDQQAEAFAPDFHVVRFDLRGHGQSQVPVGDYSIERLGRDVIDIVDALGCDRINFCGLSLGGMTGFWLAIHARERLDRFVVANGAPFAGGPPPWIARLTSVARDGLAPIAATIVPRWFTPDHASERPDIVATFRAALLSTPIAGYLGGCAAIRDLDLRPGIAGITTPTLLIGGAYDQTPFPAVIEGLSAMIPSSRAVILDTAHMSNVADPAGFNQALAAFLG